MRQLLTRIDDGLHEALKARAATESKSVNSLVTDLLEAALQRSDPRAAVRRRIAALGLEVIVEPPREVRASRDEVIASTHGSGTAVSDALDADRNHR